MAGLNGLPKFKLRFIELAAVLIQKAPRGVLGVLLFDDTDNTFTKKIYYNATEVKEKEWTKENYNALKSMAFRGNAFKVIVYKATKDNMSEVLKVVEKDEPNYFCCPFIPTGTEESPSTVKSDLESWIKSIRNEEGIELGKDTSTIKLVISSDAKPDCPFIIDYDARQTHHEIAGFKGTNYDAQAYTLCIASMCAGVALNSSITSMEQGWLTAFKTTVPDENTAIGEGKLLTGYDGLNTQS